MVFFDIQWDIILIHWIILIKHLLKLRHHIDALVRQYCVLQKEFLLELSSLKLMIP